MEVPYTAAILFVFSLSSVQGFVPRKALPLDVDSSLITHNDNETSLPPGPRPYGTYLYEGDMVMPLGALPNAGSLKPWPGGIIPFVIDCSLQARPSSYLNTLKLAMKSWQEKTSGCIRFVPKGPKDTTYVRFAKGNGCSSGGVGFEKRNYTVTTKDGCDLVNVMEHELGHVIGFWHEQTRPDRGRYIDIFWSNIRKGWKHNFNVRQRSEIDYQGEAYDYNSIMHYPKEAFGLDEKTITMLPKNRNRVIHPYETISEIDVRQTLKMYKCSLPAKRSIRSVETEADENGNICKDDNAKCPEWAARNECERNPRYMLLKCAKSCDVCDCTENHASCEAWAKANECQRNPIYMLTNCRKHCGLCKEVIADCKDSHSSCPYWAANGYCKSNPGSVLRTCRKSCGLCEGSCVDKGTCRLGDCHSGDRTRVYDAITRCKVTCRICKPAFKATVKPTTTPSPTTVKATPKITKPPPIRYTFPDVPVPEYNGMKCPTEHERCKEFSSKNCNQPWIQRNCYNLCKNVVYLEEPLCDKVEIKAKGRCSEPFGISAFHNPKSRIPFRLQSIYPHYITTGSSFHASPYQARLYNQPDMVRRRVGSWCAAPRTKREMEKGYEDYLEIKFDRQRTVGSLATQGRPGTFEHTKTYKLRFYDEIGKSWWYKESGSEAKIFEGNCHNEVPVINYLKEPQTAVRMRIYPLKYAGARCLRVELYGC